MELHCRVTYHVATSSHSKVPRWMWGVLKAGQLIFKPCLVEEGG